MSAFVYKKKKKKKSTVWLLVMLKSSTRTHLNVTVFCVPHWLYWLFLWTHTKNLTPQQMLLQPSNVCLGRFLPRPSVELFHRQPWKHFSVVRWQTCGLCQAWGCHLELRWNVFYTFSVNTRYQQWSSLSQKTSVGHEAAATQLWPDPLWPSPKSAQYPSQHSSHEAGITIKQPEQRKRTATR